MSDTTTEVDEEYPDDIDPSPEDLSSTTRTAFIEGNTLTVNVAMSKATQYAQEKKEVNTFFKVSLPDGAVNEEGHISPNFLTAVDQTAQQMLNLCEVAAARQHGLEVSSDGATVRVLNLFPGSTSGRAAAAASPAVAPGPFSAPAAAPATMAQPQAPVAQVAPAGPPAQGFPQPAAPVQGFAQPAQAQGQQRVNWKDLDAATKAQIGQTIEGWVNAGFPQTQGLYNDLQAQYPKVKVNGVAVWLNVLQSDPNIGAGTKAWIQQAIAAGQIVPPPPRQR